jgi:hypothetical protein
MNVHQRYQLGHRMAAHDKWRRRIAALLCLGAAACGSGESEELGSIEFEDGNVLSFRGSGEVITITEVGPASNAPHYRPSEKKPSEVFRELAPGRAVPSALVAHEAQVDYWQDLPAGTLVFPSREAYERFDMATLDRSKLASSGPTWMGPKSAPPQTMTSPRAATPQSGGFQQDSGVCGSFIASQCNLNAAGMLGSVPDDIIVLDNFEFLRIDDSQRAHGHHSMCAADDDASLSVFVNDFPDLATGGDKVNIPEGSFATVTWTTPFRCIRDPDICFVQESFVGATARTNESSTFHYCRAYDSNPA